MTRAQISEVTLKRLWKRALLTEAFLGEVRIWLLAAGWALFDTGSVYGAVRSDAMKNWPSLASRRIADELALVARGELDFKTLERLLPVSGGGEIGEVDEEPPEQTEDE